MDTKKSKSSKKQMPNTNFEKPDKMIEQAIKLLKTGKVDEAEKKFKEISKEYPDFVQPYIGLGNIYSIKKDSKKAIEFYQKALDIEPSTEIYSNIGTLYFIQGDKKKAENFFHSAIAMDDNNICAKKNLADVYFELGKYEQAIPLYEAGLLKQPEVESLIALANCYFKMGKYESAKIGYEKVLKVEPDNKTAKENLKIVNKELSK
ncbi:MAG: tetratricopeptide repeat protein [bacterium]|nr:tetratricopeptide repeat protein [bacterium]